MVIEDPNEGQIFNYNTGIPVAGYVVDSTTYITSMQYRLSGPTTIAWTDLLPVDSAFDELVEEVKFGVYMRSFMEWNIMIDAISRSTPVQKLTSSRMEK